MKPLLLPALALLAACSQPATQKVTSSVPSVPQKVAAAGPVEGAVASSQGAEEPKAQEVFDTTQLEPYSPERMMRVLQAHDISSLFKYDSLENPVQNGFFGPDHYRIEMVFTSVQPDSVQHNVFHIVGKSRHKKVITPFSGTLRLTTMWHQKANGSMMPSEMPYEVHGTYDLREAKGSKYAGRFVGQSELYFSLTENGSLEWDYSLGSQRGGSASVFKGTWQAYSGRSITPAIWAKNIELIAETVLPNFSIGERDVIINPKYASLGWNNYWENDEWWHETPKPALNL
jgi:hypothetical protein